MPQKTKNYRKNETQEEIIRRLKVKPSRSAAFLLSVRPPRPVIDYPSDLHHRYVAPSPRVQCLKASMGFIPMLNNAPKARNPAEPPYLFNFKGRSLNYATEMKYKTKRALRCIPRPDDTNYDTVDLECVNNNKGGMTQRVKHIQQDLIYAYMDCLNRANEAKRLAAETQGMYGVDRDRGESNEYDDNEMMRRWSDGNYGSRQFDDTDWLGSITGIPRSTIELQSAPSTEERKPGVPKSIVKKKLLSYLTEMGREDTEESMAGFNAHKPMSSVTRSDGSTMDFPRSSVRPSTTTWDKRQTMRQRSSEMDGRKSTYTDRQSVSPVKVRGLKSTVKHKSIIIGGRVKSSAKGKVEALGVDLQGKAEIPEGAIPGYLGPDGHFVELFEGETVPEGATRAYSTW